MHCHRGCRLFRIVYMLSHPFMEPQQVSRQCNTSCGDGYPNKRHQAACAIGCGLQDQRLAVYERSSASEGPQAEVGGLQSFLQPFGPAGPAPDMQAVKRLHMWTLIRSNHYPRLVIIRTEHSQPVTGVHLGGQLVMAEAPPRSAQLDLGGVRSAPALKAVSRKQRDFWWVCVLDRTLQPLMAGLLLLSFLILLWLCLSYAKEMATGPVNSEIAVKPKEMPKLDVMMIDPNTPPGVAPEKVALFKVPLESV